MKLSARNQLPGTVVEVSEGAVNGIVKIEVAPGLVISSSITNAAIEELAGFPAGPPLCLRCLRTIRDAWARDVRAVLLGVRACLTARA